MLAIEKIKLLTRQSLSPIKKFETTDSTDDTDKRYELSVEPHVVKSVQSAKSVVFVVI